MKYHVYMKTRIQKFRETHPNYDKEWRSRNIEKCCQSSRKSYQKNIKKQRMRSLIKNRKSRKGNPELWKEYYKKQSQSPAGRYNAYKQNAKKRGIKFEITKEQFMEFWQKPCSYCGNEIKTIGIDRINNNVGYIKGNLKSCCGWCNKMKMDHNEKEFLDQCKKVAEYDE